MSFMQMCPIWNCVILSIVPQSMAQISGSASLLLGLAGIGKSISMKLAEQGLNVVLVALGDPLLDATLCELQAAFPAVTFRKVRIQFSSTENPHRTFRKVRQQHVCARNSTPFPLSL